MLGCNLKHGVQSQSWKSVALSQRLEGSEAVGSAKILRKNIPDLESQCKGLKAEMSLVWSGHRQEKNRGSKGPDHGGPCRPLGFILSELFHWRI